MLLKIQKLNQKTVGTTTYSSDKKGTSVAQFWLSFYADAYSFPFFSPFLDLSLKHAPDPHFLILEPTRLPNEIFLVSCIFLIILIPIASSFWITPLIWWVGRLVELWGERWGVFATTRPPKFQGGEGGCRDEAVAMFMHCRKAIGHDERGGAEVAGLGEREADNTTRGGKGRMTRGKHAADETIEFNCYVICDIMI